MTVDSSLLWGATESNTYQGGQHINRDNWKFTLREMPLQVLEDNIYEQRARRRLEADARADAGTLHAAGPQDVAAEPLPSSSGKIPDEGGLASESPAEPMETGQGSASQSKVPSSSADKGTGNRLCLSFPRVFSCLTYGSQRANADDLQHLEASCNLHVAAAYPNESIRASCD